MLIIPKKGRQTGFTLLEALISVVVISFGLLGILGLQTVGLKNTHVSGGRTVAAMEIENMVSAIRANAEAVADDAFNQIKNPSAGSAPETDCSKSACTAAQLAEYDAYQWDERIANTLPNGQGAVACVNVGGVCPPDEPTFMITVTWNEKDQLEGANNQQQYSVVIRP